MNPTERIMHIVVQKQINHDQRLSCLYEDKFPQHIFVVTVTVYSGWHIWSADNYVQNLHPNQVSVTQWLGHKIENKLDELFLSYVAVLWIFFILIPWDEPLWLARRLQIYVKMKLRWPLDIVTQLVETKYLIFCPSLCSNRLYFFNDTIPGAALHEKFK